MCMPGARLGHIANALRDDPYMDDKTNVLVLAGTNDIRNLAFENRHSYAYVVDICVQKVKAAIPASSNLAFVHLASGLEDDKLDSDLRFSIVATLPTGIFEEREIAGYRARTSGLPKYEMHEPNSEFFVRLEKSRAKRCVDGSVYSATGPTSFGSPLTFTRLCATHPRSTFAPNRNSFAQLISASPRTTAACLMRPSRRRGCRLRSTSYRTKRLPALTASLLHSISVSGSWSTRRCGPADRAPRR